MKKQNKGVPTNRDIRWDRLDNTAHLFPVIAGESMSNVYRISVTLKEEINPELLQRALDMVLPKFDGFNLRLRQGVFWYYFEERIPDKKGISDPWRKVKTGRVRRDARLYENTGVEKGLSCDGNQYQRISGKCVHLERLYRMSARHAVKVSDPCCGAG